jgi:ABC-type glycerol-3-phosphate transport system permease component
LAKVERSEIPRRRAGQKGFGHYIAVGVIAVAVVIYLIPIYWIVVTSLKSPGDIATQVPKFLFRVTLENYQKLMPETIPGITYLFLAEALLGILLGFLPFGRFLSIRVRQLPLLWNGLFALTCIYAFVITFNYNFPVLVVFTAGTYWLISKTTADTKQLRFAFVNAGVFALVAVCLSLADGGSKYFYQLLNSIIIGVGSTILAVGLGTLSAYAFSRFPVAGKEDLLFFILSTRMLPPVVVVIPIYLMYSALGLRDTHFGLILLYTTFNVSFAVWLMKGFIDEIPKEYEDAALVDGYTRFQTFLKVVLPQSVTGIAATAVFCLITAWNEFAFALVLTEVGGRAVTAPPSITSATGSGGLEWGKIAAGTFVFLLPVAVFTFLMRNHLLRGVTFGAVKK